MVSRWPVNNRLFNHNYGSISDNYYVVTNFNEQFVQLLIIVIVLYLPRLTVAVNRPLISIVIFCRLVVDIQKAVL